MPEQRPVLLPVGVGDVICVADADYCYGLGELRLRITEVGRVQHLSDGPWLNLSGIELRRDGTPLKAEPRTTLVRVAALRSRPAGRTA